MVGTDGLHQVVEGVSSLQLLLQNVDLVEEQDDRNPVHPPGRTQSIPLSVYCLWRLSLLVFLEYLHRQRKTTPTATIFVFSACA